MLDSNGTLSRIAISTGSTTVMTTGGPSEGKLVTDGTNLYVAAGFLYKVPVGQTSAAMSSFKYVDPSKLPTGGTIQAVQVDANAVYFGNFADVFKTKK